MTEVLWAISQGQQKQDNTWRKVGKAAADTQRNFAQRGLGGGKQVNIGKGARHDFGCERCSGVAYTDAERDEQHGDNLQQAYHKVGGKEEYYR